MFRRLDPEHVALIDGYRQRAFDFRGNVASLPTDPRTLAKIWRSPGLELAPILEDLSVPFTKGQGPAS
jgi:hypothetical protein